MAERSRALAALAAAVTAQARVSTAARRAVAAVDGVVAGFVDAALSADEKTALGVRLYDASSSYREPGALFEWERAWFDARLPRCEGTRPRVLVGGCGAGREVIALRDRGFDVVGFEPAASLRALAMARCPDVPIRAHTWESWAAGAPGTWDAIVFGWGSLSHVLDPAARRAAINAAHRSCPDGPILLSYWARTFDPVGGARRAGARLGGLAARARRVSASPSGDVWQPSTGFVHPFSADELQELAAGAGRELVREGGPGDYPHATLLPRT